MLDDHRARRPEDAWPDDPWDAYVIYDPTRWQWVCDRLGWFLHCLNPRLGTAYWDAWNWWQCGECGGRWGRHDYNEWPYCPWVKP